MKLCNIVNNFAIIYKLKYFLCFSVHQFYYARGRSSRGYIVHRNSHYSAFVGSTIKTIALLEVPVTSKTRQHLGTM